NPVERALLLGIERDARLAARVGGIHGLLGYLNARLRFRFTAICELSGIAPWHRVYDRNYPAIQCASDSARAVRTSLTFALGQPGIRPDRLGQSLESWADDAALGVQSVLGALVRRADGEPCAVLCHYDLRPRLAHRYDPRILDHVARRLGTIVTDGLPIQIRSTVSADGSQV
ncbi:MAG: hypothetical protein ABI442_06840, partial [Gemmatimonadaceae bacterium]